MSMVSVPSMAGGVHSLPAELRTDQNVPRGNAWGWQRLHNNQTMSHLPVDPPIHALAGIGYYDAEGIWQPDESPYPVVYSDGTQYGGYSAPIDWASIISSATRGIDNTLAITQGGSLVGQNVYGSPTTASIAAGNPAASVNLGAGTASISTPLLLAGVALVALMVLKK